MLAVESTSPTIAPTLRDRVVLQGMMLTPVLIVFGVLYSSHSLSLTLAANHVTMLLYSLASERRNNFLEGWQQVLKRSRVHPMALLKRSELVVMSPCMVILACYITFRLLFEDFSYANLRLPHITSIHAGVIFAIQLAVINPIAEEIFWRGFCELNASKDGSKGHELYVAFHYSLYHWFIFYYVCQNALLSTAAFIGIWGLGHVFTLIKKRFRLITAILVHAGVDIAAGLALWDLQSQIFPFY